MQAARRLLCLVPALLLAACVAAPVRQPESPLPLPQQVLSPLPLPQMGPAAVVASVAPRGYMPLAEGGTLRAEDGCSLNPTAAAMLETIRSASWQQRANVVCEPRLAAAADWKANDMAARIYASHITPEGTGPNDYVRSFGYELPEWYVPGENNVESYAAGYSTPTATLLAWSSSFSHWQHVTASHTFFQGQTCAAVGYAYRPGVSWQHWYVFLSAPCP